MPCPCRRPAPAAALPLPPPCPCPCPQPSTRLAVAVGGGSVAHQLVALLGLHRHQLLAAGSSGASSSSTACECAASMAKFQLIGGMPAEQDNAGRMLANPAGAVRCLLCPGLQQS